jgi:hypothetical protein
MALMICKNQAVRLAAEAVLMKRIGARNLGDWVSKREVPTAARSENIAALGRARPKT